MSKQDRQGVRTAAELGRKYDFSAIGKGGGGDGEISKLAQSFSQYVASTNLAIAEMREILNAHQSGYEELEKLLEEQKGIIEKQQDAIDEQIEITNSQSALIESYRQELATFEAEMQYLKTFVNVATSSIGEDLDVIFVKAAIEENEGDIYWRDAKETHSSIKNSYELGKIVTLYGYNMHGDRTNYYCQGSYELDGEKGLLFQNDGTKIFVGENGTLEYVD